MPVGTGSINRAARSSKKTTEVVKNETKVTKDESVKVEEPKAAEAVTAEKPEGKKAAPKKTTTKRATGPQKAAVKKEAVAQEPAVEKAPELRVYGNESVFVVGNECCHFTEELPVHLL